MNPTDYPSAGGSAGFNEPPPKKSSWMKWLLGCGCGCLLVVGGVILAMFLMGRSFVGMFKESVERGRTAETRQKEAGENKVFVNSPNKLDGALKQNYVDFSFTYPKTWTFDPTAGVLGSNNFAEVDYSEDNFTHEHMSVGYFKGAFDNEESLAQLANRIADTTIAKSFSKPQKLGEGYGKFGHYDSYELRCLSTVKGTDGSMVKLWFKIELVKNPKSDKGVMVIMFGTNKDEEIKGVDDVGTKGELPDIIDSFEFK